MNQQPDSKITQIILKIKKAAKQRKPASILLNEIQLNNDLVSEVLYCRDLKKLYTYGKTMTSDCKRYKELVIEGMKIQLRKDVIINTKDFGRCVGRVLEIVGIKLFETYVPIIKIKWYYDKKDMTTALGIFEDQIGSKELFLSDKIDFIQPDMITDLANVLQFAEYDKLAIVKDNVYYTRAKLVRMNIKPPIRTWRRHCLCKTVMNPDQLYIYCDQCHQWYHLQCIGMSEETAQKLEKYICKKCQ